MKKILKLFVVVCFVLGFMSLGVLAQAPDRVEISFRVGDSILNINGNPVEIETPYVVDGVTLVPARVITEAFGANVEWVGETRQIIFTYRNVRLVLQIDNINAYVNDQRQALLARPELTNGVTMVPLRFITENFGAEVGWDAQTQAITVVKEAFNAPVVDIESILQPSSQPRIGDSFLGWSMRSTPNMELRFRQFDGGCNIFVLSNYAFIDIDHFANTESATFAAIRATEMEHARRFTLIGQETRQTASGAQFVATQFRDRADFVERRVFVRPNDQIVLITTVVDNSAGIAARNEYLAIVDTFDFVFTPAETEDLSDVVNGMRLFDNRDFRLQFRVPAEWWEWPEFNRVNHFFFGAVYKDNILVGACIEIVSVQSGDSAQRWAAELLEQSRRSYNPNTHNHSALRTTQINGVTATYFQLEGRLGTFEFANRRIVWEYQGYLYRLNITVHRNDTAIIQRIIDSVQFEAIDSNVVGVMIRVPIEEDVIFSSVRNTTMGFTVDIPATWSRFDNNSTFSDGRNGVTIYIEPLLDSAITIEELRAYLRDASEDFDLTIIRQPAAIPAGQLSSGVSRGIILEYRYDSEQGRRYVIEHVITIENRGLVLTAAFPEHVNSPATREIISEIVRSFVVN